MSQITLSKNNIVGRAKQLEALEKYMNSDCSEFIALYGRRRVGKTFLVKEALRNQLTIHFTGRESAPLTQQLLNFHYALVDAGGNFPIPTNWTEAFRYLSKFLEKKKEMVKIVFIDELPWLDTAKSGFLGALEYFWNNWASYRNDIKLIVCGSATSWMLDKVINSRGGLHNRVTHKMLISPWTLKDVEAYFKSKDFSYDRSEIMECYMALGGIAYYLSLFEPEKSVAQNIDDLCFVRGAELEGEHDRLFQSLFKNSTRYSAVIEALSEKGIGMTRQEIVDKTGLVNNGNLSTLLKELEECDFVRSYSPFRKNAKEKLFQLIDQYTLFYHRFIKPKRNFAKNYWLKVHATSAYSSWCGYAFEKVCLHHLEQITDALGIEGIISESCSWSYRPQQKKNDAIQNNEENLNKGAQIDLLIDRNDNVINVCEMKFSMSKYEITKEYYSKIQERIEIFKRVTKTRKSVVPVFITSFGLSDNAYARKIARSIEMNALFG